MFLETSGLEYHLPTSSKSKLSANKSEIKTTDSKTSQLKEPHLTTLQSHSKLTTYYPHQSQVFGSTTLSDSGGTFNRKNKRKTVKMSAWRCQKRTDSPISLSPTQRKRQDSDSLRQRRNSDSPQQHQTSRSSSRCKDYNTSRKSFVRKHSKSPRYSTRSNAKSESSNSLHRLHSPTLPLNQLDNKWNGRFLDRDVSLSAEDDDDNISDRENRQRRHSKRNNEKDLRRKRRRIMHTKKSEHSKTKDFLQNFKIRRPSLLPAPATLEEHIDKL